MKVGVLALQGAFALHAEVLRSLGAHPIEVRRAEHLDVDALVLPGGESTTISMLLDSSGLRDALVERLAGGMPTLGTCAGLILLATDVHDGRADQHSLGVLRATVRRNAYGRQIDSFEAPVALVGDEVPFPGVFIRAPVIVDVGEGVEVLARHEGTPVLVADGGVVGATFHPELAGDSRVHRLFLERIEREGA